MPNRPIRLGLSSLLLLAAIAAGPAAADVSVGSTIGGFVRVKGAVTGSLPDQAPASKAERSPALFGEIVATGDNSGATIGFIDHSHLLLSQRATITIDSLVFNPKTGIEEAAYTLTQGAARLISGTIKGDSLRINTPTATLAVRGTNLKLKVEADGSTLVSVNSGEVALSDRAGKETVTLKAGQSVRVDRDGVGDVADSEAEVDDAELDDASLDGDDPDLPDADLADLGFSAEDIADIEAALDAAENGDDGEGEDAGEDAGEGESDGGGDGGGGDGGGGD